MNEFDSDLPAVAPAPLAKNRQTGATAWFEANARALSVVTGAVAVVAIGAVGWRMMARGKAERADRALAQAMAGAQEPGTAGQTALRQVAVGYDGTPAGTAAAMLLAQSLYDAGRYDDGLQALRRVDATERMAPGVRALEAAGQEGLGHGAEAAKIYEALAADAADPERATRLLADAARARAAVGDAAGARRLWSDIASRGTAAATEARVRLGELEAAARAGAS